MVMSDQQGNRGVSSKRGSSTSLSLGTHMGGLLLGVAGCLKGRDKKGEGGRREVKR